jgi:N,N'-diacetyllegionaminate synthase
MSKLLNYFSELKKCQIIAEIGVNHNGDMMLAKSMITEAKIAGADAVKFQTFTAKSLASEGTPKVDYQKKLTPGDESHYQMLQRLELSKSDHFLLVDFCKKLDIIFLSTPYDIENAKFLQEVIDVEMFKTASADLVDLPLHEYIASTHKPVIISVGMASMGEIEDVIKIYQSYNNKNIVLLHCVSNYPCKSESINMEVMNTLGQAFQFPVGFSDHSVGQEASILSVAYKAKVIEKHFTIDKSLDGPDHLASATPSELATLINSIRKAENMLGSPVKEIQDEELQMAKVSRKSMHFSRDMNMGEVIQKKDIILIRPGSGLYISLLPHILGRRVNAFIKKGSMVNFSDFS